MTGWTKGEWVEAGRYGLVGYEIQANGRSIAIVNRVAAQRLEHLNEKRSKAAVRGTPEADAEREAAEIEAGEAEALANAHLMAAALDLHAALATFMRLGSMNDQAAIDAALAALAKAEGR